MEFFNDELPCKKRKKFTNPESHLLISKSKCDCLILTPVSCSSCVKLARNIYSIYGKRVALSKLELENQAPAAPATKESDEAEKGFLVFADESCSCPAVDSDNCKTCADFAVKMGAFMRVYSSTSSSSPEFPVNCHCAYLSRVGCHECKLALAHIERTFGKKVYDTRPARKSIVAIDCEMVGVLDFTLKNKRGRPKMVDALARCSVVDMDLNVLLDVYVKPDKQIADYRTPYSGIRKKHMVNAVPMHEARKQILELIKDKILVGHTIQNDLSALRHHHPPSRIRDISKCTLLTKLYQKRSCNITEGVSRIGLKKLSSVLLGSRIQEGSHCSVEDAIHTMKLYLMVDSEWESNLALYTADIRDSSQNQTSAPVNSEYLSDSYWSSAIPFA